jgi:hypothetical protein
VFAILHFPVSYFARLGNTLSNPFSHISNSMSPSLAKNCFGITCPYDSTVRALFTDKDVHIYGWPSRGGVIVLDSVEAIDFEFLGLNPLDPPMKRLDDKAAEDAFCRRLLLLGAKWWDSEARYTVVARLEVDGVRANEEPPPTMREKRFVKVGWPSTGGLWVAEFDTTFAGVDEEDNLLPYDEGAARLRMARTMDERCAILRDRFKARFYENVKHYKGYAYLNSWETKEIGEVGPLLQPEETIRLWRKAI